MLSTKQVTKVNNLEVKQLTVDHKPNNESERLRITSNGGKVYRSKSKLKRMFNSSIENLQGPYRVLPGKLSVSRTFGDYRAKNHHKDGNSKVLIATPDIKKFKITSKMQYLLLGSDGLFEHQSNEDLVNYASECICSWKETKSSTLHQFVGDLSTSMLTHSMKKGSRDNISCVIVAFKSFINDISKKNESKSNSQNWWVLSWQ